MELGREKCRIGNASLFIKNKDYSCRYMWMTKMAGKKAEYGSRAEEVDEER